MWVGADISLAIDVAQERIGHLPNTHFVQANALHLPFAAGSFDTVFSEGVLHHTPSTRAALLSSARVLAKGGQFHFYVYRRKGPLREFTDDYIRAQIAPLSDQEAWAAMRSLTRLGQSLAELQTQVRVEEDVPLLGIGAGQYDVQRLIYYQFAKLYWNPKLSFEENVHINFDWYRPQYAHRQSAEEVRAWCAEANLEVERLFEDESGITVRAVKG
jgi:SAM-dependent methyltransferase